MMSGVLSFIIFGGLFFLLMRFGCGAHAGHGGHGQHSEGHDGVANDRRDPVCSMQVPPDSGYAKIHQGHEYHFCSRNCLDKFEANPATYTSLNSSVAHQGGHAS